MDDTTIDEVDTHEQSIFSLPAQMGLDLLSCHNIL